MEYVLIGIVGTFFWMMFEMWKAPLLDQKPDGSWVELRKERKIMDFFKKKNKNK